MLQWSRISRSFVIPQSDKIQQLSRQLQIIQIHDDLCQAPFAGNKKNKLLSPGTKEAATTIPMDAIQRKNTAAYLKSQRLFTIPMQNTPEE